MTPLEQQLQSDEWLIFSGRAHWIRFVLPGLPGVMAAVLWRADHHRMALAFLAAGVFVAVPLILESFRSRFIVTNRRVILRRGLLSQQHEALALAEIASIELHQDVVGRWLKAGRITLTTQDGRARALPWIERARTFRRLALEQQRVARESTEARLPLAS